MPTTSPLTTVETERLLNERYGPGISAVRELVAGAWSQAFSFVRDGTRHVIRWSDVLDNFERDARAAGFRREGLPVPAITDMGEAAGKFFAVSPFVSGAYLEALPSDELSATLPAVLKMLRAIRSVDLSGTTGFGFWDAQGNGGHPSWRAFLLDDKDASPGSLIQGWRANLDASVMGTGAYERLRERFEGLVERCPEERRLVHCDLLNRNVLAQDGRITAVLDWGSSFYGDPLYDVIWFQFCEYWYPHFTPLKLSDCLLADFKADPSTNKTDIEARVRCYQLDIGLGAIAYNAFKSDWQHAQEAAEYTARITS